MRRPRESGGSDTRSRRHAQGPQPSRWQAKRAGSLRRCGGRAEAWLLLVWLGCSRLSHLRVGPFLRDTAILGAALNRCMTSSNDFAATSTVSSREKMMLKLFYAPGTCALASHIALAEAG